MFVRDHKGLLEDLLDTGYLTHHLEEPLKILINNGLRYD